MENYYEYKDRLTDAVTEAVLGESAFGKTFSLENKHEGRFLNVSYPMPTDGNIGFSISDSLSASVSRRMIIELEPKQVEQLIKKLSSLLPKAKKDSLEEEAEPIEEKLTDTQREIKKAYKANDAKYDNAKWDAKNREAKKDYIHKMRIAKKTLHGDDRKEEKKYLKRELNDKQHFHNSMKGKNNSMKRYDTRQDAKALDHQTYAEKERKKFDQAMKEKKPYKL